MTAYNLFLSDTLAFAQRALAAADIFALTAALRLPRALPVVALTTTFDPLTLAHLALAAAEILARAVALILNLFFAITATSGWRGEPKMRPSVPSSNWILSLIQAARRNSRAERFAIDFVMTIQLDILACKVNGLLFNKCRAARHHEFIAGAICQKEKRLPRISTSQTSEVVVDFFHPA
jgi:hypothetical protein